jgi:hypothetical protein
MGRRARAKFNQEWRKFRKLAKVAQRTGQITEDLLIRAVRFNVDLYREKVK